MRNNPITPQAYRLCIDCPNEKDTWCKIDL